MSPTLHDGDYVITLKPRSIRAGFIYVMWHDRHGQIIKRAGAMSGGVMSYQSDNSEGNSGQINTDHIKARAWLAITPKGVKRLRPQPH